MDSARGGLSCQVRVGTKLARCPHVNQGHGGVGRGLRGGAPGHVSFVYNSEGRGRGGGARIPVIILDLPISPLPVSKLTDSIT